MWRKIKDRTMIFVLLLFCFISILPLIFVFYHLISQGLSSLDWDFFTKNPLPVGEKGGGMANAIVGTLILIALASIFSLPVGILTGIFLSEFGGNKVAYWARLSCDVLQGVPSIVIGIFAYSLIVVSTGKFSALAGGFALGVMMVPTVARTTEEVLKLVPDYLREASLALGVPQWRTVVLVVLKTAIGGIMTGVLISIARISGETAPLLFTAFGNRFFSININKPISALPLQIFNYAISPYPDWHRQAWAGALVLVAIVVILNLVSRVITTKMSKKT